MSGRPVCLVIDAESQLGPEWRSELGRSGFVPVLSSAVESRSASPALIMVTQSTADPGATWSLVEKLAERYPTTPVMLASRCARGLWSLATARFHHVHRLSQPVSCGCVWKLLEGFLNQPELPEIVGESAALQRVRETIGRVSPSEVNVLISGESGTGKELVAELIHRSSTRSKGPFVSVNCAAIPDSLLESELFGHAKGAFTGADCSREGKFSEADGGTLFLDEIGDMSHYAQAKVLRAIETKRIDRLGARGGHLVNIRVLVATNRNLEQMMSTGQFRQDLYFRLNVIELNLPPLRERKEDIASLVTHFTSVFNRRFGADLSRFSDEVLDALCSYHWPGNVRELRNLFEAIYINSPPRILSLGDLPESFRRRLASAPSDKSRMLDALASTQWNKSKAAKSLGWSRVTLYRKLAQYHVSPSSPPNSATAPASLSRESYK